MVCQVAKVKSKLIRKKQKILKKELCPSCGSREGGAAGNGCGSLGLLESDSVGEHSELSAQPPRLGNGQLAAISRRCGSLSR